MDSVSQTITFQKKSSLYSRRSLCVNRDPPNHLGKSDNNLIELKRISRFSELGEIKEEKKISDKMKLIHLKQFDDGSNYNSNNNNDNNNNNEVNVINTISSMYEEEKKETNTFEIKNRYSNKQG